VPPAPRLDLFLAPLNDWHAALFPTLVRANESYDCDLAVPTLRERKGGPRK